METRLLITSKRWMTMCSHRVGRVKRNLTRKIKMQNVVEREKKMTRYALAWGARLAEVEKWWIFMYFAPQNPSFTYHKSGEKSLGSFTPKNNSLIVPGLVFLVTMTWRHITMTIWHLSVKLHRGIPWNLPILYRPRKHSFVHRLPAV